MWCGCSILTIYEHGLEWDPKLSSHTAKLSNTLERRDIKRTGKQVKKKKTGKKNSIII